MTAKCRGLWGHFFGHKFEGRYSEKERPSNFDSSRVKSAAFIKDFRTLLILTDTIYHGDVCVRCGLRVGEAAK